MHKILILLLFPISAFSTNYNWSVGSTNINLTNATFGTLNAGDTVFIPFKTGGYRSFSFSGLNSGVVGGYIVIYWQGGAFITPSASSLAANTMDNCKGVRIVNMIMNRHVDNVMRHGTTAYSSWIRWDSCQWNGMPGFGPRLTGTLPSFGGDTTQMFHHWQFHKCSFDSLYDGATASSGLALRIGGTTAGFVDSTTWWRDVIIDSCYFADYAANGSASNFIAILEAFKVYVYGNTFTNLGVVSNPTGHASLIITDGSLIYVYGNFFGPDNFGNEIRSFGSADLPLAGPNYIGRSQIYNNITYNKRKYPFVETRYMSSSDSTILAPFARPRTSPLVNFITAYNLAIGTGHGPYETNIVDCYETDTVTVRNSTVIGCRDSTFTAAFGPFIYSNAAGNVGFKDTANNRLSTTFAASGMADTTTFKPILNGILYNNGAALPSYITTDYYNTPRPSPNGRGGGSGLDIGAVQLLFLFLTIPYGVRIIAQ